MTNMIIITIAVAVMLFAALVFLAGHNFDSDFGKFMKKVCIFDFVIAFLALVYALTRIILKI